MQQNSSEDHISTRGSLYPLIIVFLCIPIFILFAFPTSLPLARCAMVNKDTKSWYGTIQHIHQLRSLFRSKSTSEWQGHRLYENQTSLDNGFKVYISGGPSITQGLSSSRGSNFIIQNKSDQKWVLDVGGTPGVEPVWSAAAEKIAFYRLERLWLSDEFGKEFVSIAHVGVLNIKSAIRWNCNGSALAIGNPSSGWKVVYLVDEDLN